MRLAVCLIAAIITFVSPAQAGETAFTRELIKEALGPDSKVDAIADKDVHSVLLGVLDQHVGANLPSWDNGKIEKMHAKLRDTGFVLRDGDLAAVSYLDLSKPYVLSMVMMSFPEWRKANPDSALPYLVYASTRLSQIAQYARASITVREVNREPFDADQVDEVRQYLEKNKAIAARSGYWHILMTEIAILQKSGDDKIKELVREGLEAFPDNVQLAVRASNYFLPRWHGDAKALENYAQWALSLPALKGRPDIYAQIYANAMNNHYGLTLFKFAPKNWKQMRLSIQHLVEHFPDHRNVTSAAVLACLAGDRRLTWTLIQREEVTYGAMTEWQDRDAHGLCYNWAAG